MKINKKLLGLLIVYIVAMVGFAGYKVSKGGNTYFNYKNEVIKAKTQLDSEKKDNKDDKAADNSSNADDKKGQDANNTAQAANSTASQPVAVDENAQKEKEYLSLEFKRTLQQNDKGKDVGKLQLLLKNKKYYNKEITENFDKDTLDALKRFQSDNKLQADGQLGAATWKKLEQ